MHCGKFTDFFFGLKFTIAWGEAVCFFRSLFIGILIYWSYVSIGRFRLIGGELLVLVGFFGSKGMLGSSLILIFNVRSSKGLRWNCRVGIAQCNTTVHIYTIHLHALFPYSIVKSLLVKSWLKFGARAGILYNFKNWYETLGWFLNLQGS